MKVKVLLVIGASAFFLSACDPVAEIKDFLGLRKKSLPVEVKEEMNSAQTPDPSNSEKAGALAKENSEILSEMMKVIFDQEIVEDRSNFGGLVHSLNQGASLEGIYQGIMMDSKYRALESQSQAASPNELKYFAIEMAALQATMKNPTHFQEGEASKAPSIEYPDGSSAVLPEGTISPVIVAEKKDVKEMQMDLLRVFIGATHYTLKRALASEALQKMDEMKNDAGEMANWYARFVLHMCEYKVDFGLPLRSKTDFDMHFKFAQKMSIDRVKWEVLNRYHRYLNWIEKQK